MMKLQQRCWTMCPQDDAALQQVRGDNKKEEARVLQVRWVPVPDVSPRIVLLRGHGLALARVSGVHLPMLMHGHSQENDSTYRLLIEITKLISAAPCAKGAARMHDSPGMHGFFAAVFRNCIATQSLKLPDRVQELSGAFKHGAMPEALKLTAQLRYANRIREAIARRSNQHEDAV